DRHREVDAGGLWRAAAGPLQGGQRRGRAGPARPGRRLPRPRSPREARRELHATRSRACARAGREGAEDGEDPMIPELGQFDLALALAVALVQAVLPIAGAANGNAAWIAVARPAARTLALLIAFAFGCLTYCFVTNDFSVQYVAE